MSAFFGSAMAGNPRFQGLHHLSCIVDRQRGLRHVRQALRIAHLQLLDILGRADQVDAAVGLAHRALDFRVPGVSDHHDFAPLRAHLGDLDVHLRDQRTGRVEHVQPRAAVPPRAPRARLRGPRKPASHRSAPRSSSSTKIAPLDRNCATTWVLWTISWRTVDGRAVPLKSAFDDLNRPIHTGTESAWLGQQNFDHYARLQLPRPLHPARPTPADSLVAAFRLGSTCDGAIL